jgi:hypothetical protein
MDLLPGDVVLLQVHFHQRQGAKARPAVIVLDSGDEDFVVTAITMPVGFDRIRVETGRLAEFASTQNPAPRTQRAPHPLPPHPSY